MIDAKQALRADMRAVRDAFVAASGPAGIQVPAAYHARLAPGAVVAAYMPIGSEADPAPLIDAAIARRCTLALPHVTTCDAPMRFLRWHSGEPLTDGPMRLRQPAADASELTPDIVLVPLLAFDDACRRLGQGAGFYDRALAELRAAWTLGTAWAVQQVPRVPVDRWDVPLHGVVTEAAFHLPKDTA